MVRASVSPASRRRERHSPSLPDAAIPLYERALSIRERRVGADHPDTAHSLQNIANAPATQGDLDGARTLFERALSIHEARLGADHPETVTNRRNLTAVEAALDASYHIGASP